MLTIRRSEARDVEAIRQIYAQSSVYASTLQLPYPSLELWEGTPSPCVPELPPPGCL